MVKREAVAKLKFCNSNRLKTAVLQPVGRKTTRACAKVTDFCNRLKRQAGGKDEIRRNREINGGAVSQAYRREKSAARPPLIKER
jgi:hypothetical protein